MKPASEIEADSYIPSLAHDLALICAWSYSDRSTLQDFAPPGYSVVDEISVRNSALFIFTTVYILIEDSTKRLIIACRGTEANNFFNYLTNTNLCKFPFGGELHGYVHDGMMQNTTAMFYKLIKILEDYKDREIYITGHSLGGAMAILCGAILCRDHMDMARRMKGVYTYGQPALGDKEFSSFYGSKMPIFRHIYGNDPVAALPPKYFGYVHYAGDRVFHTNGDDTSQWVEIIPNATPGIIERLRDTVRHLNPFVLPSTIVRLLSFVDHRPSNYTKTLAMSVI